MKNYIYASLIHSGFFFGLFMNPEDVSDMFHQNISWLSLTYTTLYPRRQKSPVTKIILVVCVMISVCYN
jgi:hypothetical protein